MNYPIVDLPRRCVRYGLRRFANWSARAATAMEKYTLIKSSDRALLDRNAGLKDSLKGRRAFVIGNGPSLNRLNLHLLKDEVVFVVNGFARHPILSEWQPVALGLIDPLYFNTPEAFGEEFSLMRSRLPKTLFFIPILEAERNRRLGLLPVERTHYLHCYGGLADHVPFDVDLTKGFPGGQTVVQNMIMAAMYMGCDKIYLIGMDHDFLATPGKPPEHFSNDYEKSANGTSVQTHITALWSNYFDLMGCVRTMWQGYINLRRAAQHRGISIINATDGGFLDVFPRETYESLFRKKETESRLVAHSSENR